MKPKVIRQWMLRCESDITIALSARSGGNCLIDVTPKCDTTCHLYLGYVLYFLSHDSSNIFQYKHRFNFGNFVAYTILNKPRPKKRSTYCVDGCCEVLTPNGHTLARDVRAGDVVSTSLSGTTARVVCTVTQEIDGVIPMCQMGGLCVTPEHPVRLLRAPQVMCVTFEYAHARWCCWGWCC